MDPESAAHWSEVSARPATLVVLGRFPSEPDGSATWQSVLEIPVDKISLLGIKFSGWLVHTMFCVTGCLGYLEKAIGRRGTNTYEWAKITNAHEVGQEAACYRYIAELHQSRMITYGDIQPRATTTSASSSSLSSTPASPLPSHRLHARPDDFGLTLISRMPSEMSNMNDFCEQIVQRDGTDVVVGSAQACHAAHLMNKFNPDWLIDYAAQMRGFAGGENRDDWRRISSTVDPQLGLLLPSTIHTLLDNAGLGIIRVPNIGMQSLDEPMEYSSSPSANEAANPDKDPLHPPPQPQPLTEESLRIHDILSTERICGWAGIKSRLYLVPFKEDPKKHFAGLDFVPLRAPQEELKAQLWPFNTIVDWCWGARILAAFGTKAICDFSRMSQTTVLVERFRDQIKPSRKRKQMAA